MKVAVVIGGVARDYWNHDRAFRMMMGNVEYDLFIYTWDLFEDKEKSCIDIITDIGMRYKCPGENKSITRMGNWDTFKEALQPRVDYYKTFKIPFPKTNLLTGIFAQHYTMKRAFDMISSPEEYDLIIRYRFDWHPEFIILWDEIAPLAKKNLLYSNQKTHGIKGTSWVINDLFAISNPKNMRVYAGLYDEMLTGRYDKYILKNKNIITEYLLVLHLKTNNIPLMPYKFPYKKFIATASKKGK